jgi:hypothetical protein
MIDYVYDGKWQVGIVNKVTETHYFIIPARSIKLKKSE